MGRSGTSADAQRQLDELEKSGVQVVVRPCNVGDRGEVAGLLAEIRSDHPPLRGVFHLAGVLDDGIFRNRRANGLTASWGQKCMARGTCTS